MLKKRPACGAFVFSVPARRAARQESAGLILHIDHFKRVMDGWRQDAGDR